jgi:uncharacterized protein (DUF2252 family)
MATFNKFQAFVEALAEKKHNLGSDTFKVQLMNTAPDAAADAIETDLPADLSTANGYTAGGVTAGTSTSSAQTSGTYKLTIADVVITATGGSIGPFRYVVLMNDTATDDDLIGYIDYGSSITLNSGETFTIDFDGSAGVLTLV